MSTTNSKLRLKLIPLPKRTKADFPDKDSTIGSATSISSPTSTSPPVSSPNPSPNPVPSSSGFSQDQILVKPHAKLTGQPDLVKKDSCYYHEITYTPRSSDVASYRIYAFDLDGTLIETESGKKFASSGQDWKFWHDSNSVPTKLRSLLRLGHSIMIITNQKGLSSGKTDMQELVIKLNSIIDKIVGTEGPWSAEATEGPGPGPGSCETTRGTEGPNEINNWRSHFGIYIASEDDRYRKSWTSIWDLIPEAQRKHIDCYVGDAAGRVGDHSSTDRYFANNIGKPFYTPEQFFLDRNNKSLGIDKLVAQAYPVYPAQRYIDSPDYSVSNYERGFAGLVTSLKTAEKTCCIMIGCPGSGKSSLSRNLVKTLGPDAIHIERDALGGNQKRFMKEIGSAMANNKKWIFADATHPNCSSRDELISFIEGSHSRSNDATGTGWKLFIIHVDTPLELAVHLDACRVQLKFSEKPLPIVVFRTFYKRFRDDEKEREAEKKKLGSSWVTFRGINPDLANLPEYHFLF